MLKVGDAVRIKNKKFWEERKKKKLKFYDLDSVRADYAGEVFYVEYINYNHYYVVGVSYHWEKFMFEDGREGIIQILRGNYEF